MKAFTKFVPNAEAYVTDADGNQVWLGAFANQAGPDVGPFATLFGDFNTNDEHQCWIPD